MFILLKSFLILISIIFINSCTVSNSNLVNINNINNVSIKTPNDKNNILFKENLKRVFNSHNNKSQKYLLKASISFSSGTLSASGLKALSSTIANINYKLYDIKSNKMLKSGTIKSSPTIGSTSVSLYANDSNLKHIKERLNSISAKKLYMHLSIIIRKLK